MTKEKTFVMNYDPKRVQTLGSVAALIVEQRLCFLFEKTPERFVKFIAPCSHRDYEPGTSWTEELGISAKKFRKAFDQIGIRYESKTAFEQEEDPFMGRRFCYYSNRRKNKTVFVENMKLANHNESNS